MIRRSVGTVVLDRQMIDGPRAEWTRGIAYRDIQVILSVQRLAGRYCTIQRKNNMEPALSVWIEMAGRVSYRGTEAQGRNCPVDRGSIAVKGIEIDRAQ